MVRALRINSGRAMIAGLLGLAGMISLAFVTIGVSKPAKAGWNPLVGCTATFATPVAMQWQGGGQHPTWDQVGYEYKSWRFQVAADGGATLNEMIDTYGPDCGGGTPPGSVSSSPFVTPDQLVWNGEKPIAATLGVPAFSSNNNGQFVPPASAEEPPTLNPPVHQQSYGRYAAFTDDSGMALINDQMVWCIGINTQFDDPISSPNPGGCSPDITTTPPHAGAGYLFVDTNCPLGGGCNDGNNFNWYRSYNNNSPELTSRIGRETDGTLKSFKLRMLARQTYQGGIEAAMIMTFKYPKTNAECVSITAPDTVSQGQNFNATVRVRNSGATTWGNTGPNPYRLGASDPRDTAKWGPITPGGFSNRALFPADVPPGQTVAVTFSATATTAGIQPFSWEVLREGIQWVGGKCSKNINVSPGSTPLLHKIYAASIVELSQQQVRDNETFVATLRTYVWPDAGRRSISSDRTNRLWLAGIYGEQAYLSGDNANSDNSKRANPSAMTSYNSRAEASCPGSSCLERVPMAYVPADDGSGQPNSATKDGSRTPNGNKWQPIRDRIFGSWDSRLGGIASDRTDNVGGYAGNRIHNVEISNIRVEAVGPRADAATASTQGGVTGSLLQPDSPTQGANLPPSSQGPIRNGLPFNAWDNIRRPGAPGGVAVTSQQSVVDFPNSGSQPANFTLSPEQLLSAFSTNVNSNARTFATANVTSLLQDGNDRDNAVPYSNLSEPLTYTAGLGSIDNARLKWDEYVDWSQVDDKGHYYTDQSYPPRATGFYTGSSTSVSRTVVSSVSTGTQRQTWHPPTSRTRCVERDKRGRCTRTETTTTPGWWEYEQPTCSSYNTGLRQTYSTYTYYTPSVQSRWGWVNRNATFGNAYASPSPTRFWPSRGGTPTWATLGTGNALNPYFYQDPSITSMSNSGSTNRNGQAQTPAWSRDFTDPTYTNRYLFVNAQSESIPTGWDYTQSTYCYYANGGTVTNTTASTSYYANPGYLYENSSGSYSGVRGSYNFTYDGNKDGHVDISWNWASNMARVRYEQTYNGNYRNLGPRSASGTGDPDSVLYGIEGYPSAAKPARATATIGSPVIAAASGDIFSAGGISSYFRNSAASSAFIFTNTGTITNFLGASGYFPNYYINPDPSRVNSVTLPGSPDSIHKIWPSFETEVVAKSQSIGGNMSGNFNLAGTANRIYRVAGNLNMGSTTFCGGPGTIYVEGDLNITGNLSYCGYGGTDRTQLPSLGVIVGGKINVGAGVTNVVGSYFTNGTFSTGTLLDAAGTNRTTRGDQPLVLNGLVVAFNFNLQRQPSGTSNLSGVAAERFVYDGRVVVATPPAFNSLYTAPAVWNEAAPSN